MAQGKDGHCCRKQGMEYFPVALKREFRPEHLKKEYSFADRLFFAAGKVGVAVFFVQLFAVKHGKFLSGP